MDGEQNGTQAQQGTQQEQGQQQAVQQPQQETQKGSVAETAATSESGSDQQAFEAQLAERDSRIKELDGQISDAAKTAETAEGLRRRLPR